MTTATAQAEPIAPRQADERFVIRDVPWHLYVSLRTTNRDVNAGDLLQQVLGSDHAGGHDMIAGGRIALPPGADWEEAASRIRTRLVAAVGMEAATPVKLCG